MTFDKEFERTHQKEIVENLAKQINTIKYSATLRRWRRPQSIQEGRNHHAFILRMIRMEVKKGRL